MVEEKVEENTRRRTPSERLVRNKDLDLLVEEDLINGKDILDLSKGRQSLGEIEDKLNALLKD